MNSRKNGCLFLRIKNLLPRVLSILRARKLVVLTPERIDWKKRGAINCHRDRNMIVNSLFNRSISKHVSLIPPEKASDVQKKTKGEKRSLFSYKGQFNQRNRVFPLTLPFRAIRKFVQDAPSVWKCEINPQKERRSCSHFN